MYSRLQHLGIILAFCLGIFELAAQSEIKQITESFQLADGVSLAQDIYFPTHAETPLPVILIRTPYGKFQYKGDGIFFANAGYITVIQDVRGKFESSGNFIPFIHETLDGLATLDWIQQQAWSNGQVALYGVSYSGFCGLTLTAAQHPALKSVVNFSGWIKPATMATPGGANHLMLNLTWLLHEETLTTRNIEQYNIDSLFRFLPQNKVFESIGIEESIWESPHLLAGVNQDFDYKKISIPILHLTGAYDFVKESTLEFYEDAQKAGHQKQGLIFGPWFHSQSHTSLTEVGEVDFGKQSHFGDDTLRTIALDWFQKSFSSSHIPQDFKARAFVQFHNQWQTFDTWPPQLDKTTPLFLGSRALSSDTLGILTTTNQSNVELSSFTYNPADPVPTNGGANFHFFPGQLGIKDQAKLDDRKDILHFFTEAYQEEQWVLGPIELKFYASSSAFDTDFTAKLVLVDPDGFAMNIADGIIRARFRNGRDSPNLIAPNQVYLFQISLGNTAFSIPKGYRLGLEISSSNFPKYDRNTNTKMDPFEASEFQLAQQKVFHSKVYPSKIILPIISKH